MRFLILTVLTFFCWSTFVTADESAPETKSAEYLVWRAEAEKLMGRTENLAQRAMFYILLYLESGKRYDFGLSAAWGISTFEIEMSKLIKWTLNLADAKEYRRYFREATQQAFVDNYANYYYAANHANEGPLPELGVDVSSGLQQLHQSTLNSQPFGFEQRHKLYEAILKIEQPQVIQPLLEMGFATIQNPITRWFFQHPPPMKSKCSSKPFKIKNFMNAQDRINGELEGHLQIDKENSYDCILNEVISMSIFPQEFKADPLGYASELRKTLLGN